MTEGEPPGSSLARIIHEHFSCIADPLLQRAFGRQAYPSDPHRMVGDWRPPFMLAPVPV